jgi:4-hydroxybenzoate polyprenyltransferase
MAASTLRWLALLRLVRWYNILLTLIAQYLCAVFVFAPQRTLWQHITDYRLHLIACCTTLIISAGFIINSFYDRERDAINHPDRLSLQRLVSKEFALRMYLWLNLAALFVAALTSFNVMIFMVVFAGGLWFYSHKLQRIPLVREVSAAILTVTAIVSVALHFGVLDRWLALYALYFMMLLFMRELIKDLVAMRGDAIFGYTTMAVWLGERKTVLALLLLWFLTLIPGGGLLWYGENIVFKAGIGITGILSGVVVFWEYFGVHRFRYAHGNLMMRMVVVLLIACLPWLY